MTPLYFQNPNFRKLFYNRSLLFLIINNVKIVTGTGKYFKNVEKGPETNLGIVRIADNGAIVELL